MAPSIQNDMLLSWISQLESAILIAAEELKAAARAADAKRVTRH